MTSYVLSACGCCLSVTKCVRYLLPGASDVNPKSLALSGSSANNNIDLDDFHYIVCDLPDVSGNEPPLTSANGQSQVTRSGQFTAEVTNEPTSPSKSSTDELDNCIKTNYVASRILNFEGITDVDPSRLKRTKPALYQKANVAIGLKKQVVDPGNVNGKAGGDGSHVIPSGKSSEGDDFRIQNGHVDGSELGQTNSYSNGLDRTSDCGCHDATSISNGAIVDDVSSDSRTPHHTSGNGLASGSEHFQQAELTAVVAEHEQEKPTENGCHDSSALTGDDPKKDGNYYLEIVNQEDKRLQATVSRMQHLLESESDIPEEASGLIRATVGKSNLLIKKKFTHYRDCCMKNLHPDPAETRHTTDADLAGLWDIVCIQISDINAMCDQIENLRKNGWKMEKAEPATTQSKKMNLVKTTRKVKVAAKKDTSNDVKTSKVKDEARTKAREEAKRRLLAAKKAGRQRKASQSDDVEIYVPG